MNKTFYERNESVINSDINVNYEDVVAMTPEEFEDWVVRMRKEIVKSWDKYGCPPRTGKNEKDIVEQFNKMAEYPVHLFTHTDELSDVEDDVIINKSRLGVEADQWFSNMMKTRINYTAKDNGHSIYDLFADDKFLPRVVRGAMRHIRRDSFYNFALSAIKNDAKYSVVSVDSGEEWIEAFFNNSKIFKGYDFILEQVKIRDGLNTGYFQIEQSKILQLTKEQVQKFKDCDWLEYRHHSTFDIDDMPDDKVYAIRVYQKGKKIFPKCFASFRIGYIQVAVNYPPMTAKYLYERFTDDIKDQEVINIYDPSSGWGGRILGAMACRDDRSIHYVGTDPNPDNFYGSEGGSKYESLADFYNTQTYRGNPFFSETNTYHQFMEGSEEIQYHPDFQQYKGNLDLIFTSPPYFNREAYSEDENQSYKKYGNTYESWRDGFLRPTLETCYHWLKSDRYMLWNIADLLVSGDYLPLEQDSIDILEGLGMEYKYVLKMGLELMPGQNRLDENGVPKCKNYCMVNGKYLKYEPVFVFYKP
tara:strand:+ start:3156 stop:4745 length:1590 start_codon:yes stop_codon:yes gene_type:complete